MQLTPLEAAALRGHYLSGRTCTPESLAERLGITLGEVREAEKTALRKIDPNAAPDEIARCNLTPLEAAVLRECLPHEPATTPEGIAQDMNVTVGEVFEAIKSGMAKLEDPGHATDESLDALGVTPR